MYLSKLCIENFRVFGSKEDNRNLHLDLLPGLNVLVGENDSGKSAIVDAIRYVLWTTSLDYLRLTEDDFHVKGTRRASEIMIQCVFKGVSTQESARFLEWLSTEDEKPCLYVTLRARRFGDGNQSTRPTRNIAVTVRSGKRGDGPPIEGAIREFLRTTYLRPLRDAEVELCAGRGSRLSQILQSHPNFDLQGVSDYDEADANCKPTTLVGIMRQAEDHIQKNSVILDTKTQLNTSYLNEFSIGNEALKGEIGVARRAELRHILEKLDLWLTPKEATDYRIPRGLGVNNVLFMATELLLLGGNEQEHDTLPLLLIEEPEAHLHPQMQLRLMDFLEQRALRAKTKSLQILVTTHSPNLASRVDLESITVLYEGQSFSLASSHTRLCPADYRFLRRFLDTTKANLFFAKGVAIVEGDAENILIPTLAKLIGSPFSQRGVSIVSVGSRALFRYARIFQRTGGRDMPVRVACITDRDIVPNEADYKDGRKESQYSKDEIKMHLENLRAIDGGSVRTFVSPKWTLEYDLAYGNPTMSTCALAFSVHVAIQLAKKVKNKQKNYQPDHLDENEVSEIAHSAAKSFREWKNLGLTREQIAAKIYEPLATSAASKPVAAQFLAERLERSHFDSERIRAHLPEYLVQAIDYVTLYVEGN